MKENKYGIKKYDAISFKESDIAFNNSIIVNKYHFGICYIHRIIKYNIFGIKIKKSI